MLAPQPGLATLPAAMTVVGAAATMIPASLLMQRAGRRAGFMTGTLTGVLAAVLAGIAITGGRFWLFVGAALLLGVYQAFSQYYRFAAADSVPADMRSRAISLVVAGGVVAAVLGPGIVRLTGDVGPVPYAAAYLASAGVALVALLLVAGLRARPLAEAGMDGPGRPIGVIMRQPVFMRAVAASASGYALMALVMHATPLAMHGHGHDLSSSASVIQWHVLGMFVPSFFTGMLIARFGLRTVLLSGVGIIALHTLIALSGQAYVHYVSGLTLLGIGWNFLYIGGTTLLTRAYTPSERARTQAAHDFLVFTCVSLASFSAGNLLGTFGWQTVNAAALVLLLIPLTAVLWRPRQPLVA